ncbi:hypothetical protein [Nocardia amamiensis]|uniref:hypothetical protein n=1 Tax=Nocardia amamiensis TaxID=404578 RepID=UPI00082DBB3B|nr:hypothetical protein [Nocardia amamiensis]
MIGVLGSTGAVGRAVLGFLAEHDVRPGTRADVGNLQQWCDGCTVVINCTGLPLCENIVAAGADYVDPSARPDDIPTRPASGSGRDSAESGNRHLSKHPTDADRPGRIAVFDAGAMPGCIGLLPRYLAAQLNEAPARLVVEAGGLYRFTPASAAEFLHTPHGWRDQAARVDQALGLTASAWTTRFDGDCVRRLLRHGTPTADQLTAASAADAAGRSEYLTFDAELTGHHGTVRSAQVRTAPDLTARIAVATALAVLHGEIPTGTHSADDVLDPIRVVPALLSDEGTL